MRRLRGERRADKVGRVCDERVGGADRGAEVARVQADGEVGEVLRLLDGVVRVGMGGRCGPGWSPWRRQLEIGFVWLWLKCVLVLRWSVGVGEERAWLEGALIARPFVLSLPYDVRRKAVAVMGASSQASALAGFPLT